MTTSQPLGQDRTPTPLTKDNETVAYEYEVPEVANIEVTPGTKVFNQVPTDDEVIICPFNS